MAVNKNRIKFVCASCGAEAPRWMGRCPVCGEWNTMQEIQERPASAAIRPAGIPSGIIQSQKAFRYSGGK